MTKNIRQIVNHGVFNFLAALLLRFNQGSLSRLLYALMKGKVKTLPPAESLRFLLNLERKLYNLTTKEAVRYGEGVHPKHRHLKYHDFFVKYIEPGSRVLDIGCGNGAVAFDIATRVAGASVYGIDLDEASIAQAQKDFAADNIRFMCGDALHDLPEQAFDVIMLSNVLEHIEQRVEFLRLLQQRYRPRKFLIRAPMFERHWYVPLKEELGVDYRLDKDHYIEYRHTEFLEEIAAAGLHIQHAQINWGEIWAEVVEQPHG